jgi:hypothetical protein
LNGLPETSAGKPAYFFYFRISNGLPEMTKAFTRADEGFCGSETLAGLSGCGHPVTGFDVPMNGRE